MYVVVENNALIPVNLNSQQKIMSLPDEVMKFNNLAKRFVGQQCHMHIYARKEIRISEITCKAYIHLVRMLLVLSRPTLVLIVKTW